VALLLVGTAAAEIGTFSFSYSVTPIGTDQIDFSLTSSTVGATTTTSNEGISNTVYLYGSTLSTSSGTYGYRSTITLNSTTGPPYAMQLASNFSFTGLSPGTYFYWVSGTAWYYSTFYSTWYYPEYDYATGALFLGETIPTAGYYGLMLLGLGLAASGFILLRRG
jgi:hypothetical protein